MASNGNDDSTDDDGLAPPSVAVLSVPGGPAVAERERFTRILAEAWQLFPR